MEAKPNPPANPATVTNSSDAEPSALAAQLAVAEVISARLNVHIGIRWLVVVALLVGTWVAHQLLGFERLPSSALIGIAAGIGSYNLLAWPLIRSLQRRAADDDVDVQRQLRSILLATVLLDYLSLSAFVWVTGGARSQFLPFYVLHVVVCSMLLSWRRAIFSTAVAILMLGGLIVVEWRGLAKALPPLGLSDVAEAALDGRYYLTLLIAYTLLLGLTAFLFMGLSAILRDKEARLMQAKNQVETLSERRRDFLHIVIHNLKSPVGAVTMHLRNLVAGFAGPLEEQQSRWVNRSLARLQELSELLGDLNTLSMAQSESLARTASAVDVGDLLRELVESYQDAAAHGEQSLVCEVPPQLPPVMGHERLIREAVANYITNALKFSPRGAEVVVAAEVVDHAAADEGTEPWLRIEVRDSGIGIAAEDHERLFREYVRVGRAKAPSGKVKGTGLGLAIVKRVAEAHGGTVGVQSVPDVGSTFSLDLPLPRTSLGLPKEDGATPVSQAAP